MFKNERDDTPLPTRLCISPRERHQSVSQSVRSDTKSSVTVTDRAGAGFNGDRNFQQGYYSGNKRYDEGASCGCILLSPNLSRNASTLRNLKVSYDSLV
jgi:hypothetical protein